jgi:hypothetical protein
VPLKGNCFTFPVLEVAIGEYDADITVLVAEAAKSVNERRRLPRITTGVNEDVIKTISGKWQRSINCDMQVTQPVYVIPTLCTMHRRISFRSPP